MSIYARTRQTLNKQGAKIVASVGNELTRTQVFLDLVGEQIDLAEELYAKKMDKADIENQMATISNAVSASVEAAVDTDGKKTFSNDLKRKIELTARLSNDQAYQSLQQQWDVINMDIEDCGRCHTLYSDMISFVKQS